MKRLTALLLALLLAILPTAVAENATLRVTNCTEWVSLRSAPEDSAPRLATVPLDAVVDDCTFADNGFIACRYGDQTGYIAAAYLAPDAGEVALPAMRVANCDSWVSLRSAPDAAADRLTTVPLGDTVTDCAFAGNGFVRCTYDGTVGYILCQYLTAAGQEALSDADIAIEPTSPLSAPAAAPGAENQRQVADCETWISLRSAPDTGARRLAQVPLGAILTDCEDMGMFTRCKWSGVEGYVLTAYTAPVGSVTFTRAQLEKFGSICCTQTVGDCTLIAARGFGDMETLRISLLDSAMQPLWSAATGNSEIAMLTATEAFAAGTDAQPMIALFNSALGVDYSDAWHTLTMLSADDGHIVWSMSAAQSGLTGGSISSAVDAEGNMYIGGYLGPDPVCISADGRVLWSSSANDGDIYWLYEITLTDGGIIACYESGDNGEMASGNCWEVFYAVDPAAIAIDPFITPSRVELVQH